MVRIISDEQERKETNEGTRRSFLRRAALAAAGGGVAATMLTPTEAKAYGPFLIGLAFRDIRKEETDHVTFLINLLGSNARPKPAFFNLKRFTLLGFLKVAQTLENLAAGAYLGTLQYFFDSTKMAAAASIGFIEARHGTFLNVLLDKRITTNVTGKVPSFETTLSQLDVLKLVGRFLANLNGGPPLAYSTTLPSPANDIAILNFLLALEYMSLDFYTVNLPMFMGGFGGGARV